MTITDQDKERLKPAGPEEIAFVNSFFLLFRTAQYVNINNDSYKVHSARFSGHFSRLLASNDEIVIKIIEGRIFINEKLAKFDSDGMVRARGIIDRWRMVGIGGIILENTLACAQIDRFVNLIANISHFDKNQDDISTKLNELGIDGLKLLGVVQVEEMSSDLKDQRVMMRRSAQTSFFRAIGVVQNAMTHASQDTEVDVSKTRRVIHSLIDLLYEDESALIELTSIRDFDEYTYAHTTNVCIYSLTIGIKLGLDRKRLSHLGFAALFHDMGKVRLPEDLISKPDRYDENDWIQMQKHPIWGAKTILRNCKFDEHTARAARAAMEHHINEDFTGYPLLRNKVTTNLFSKIVAIADTFDALTSGRVYIKKSISPDEVLRKMMYQMTVKFDAFLLKLFVNIIGVYPPGIILLLSTDELAIVVQNNSDNLARPVIKIIGDKSGPYEQFLEIDLAKLENASRQVKKIIDPTQYNIDVKSIILSNA